MVGALLPWVSLFAGLQAYAGITGLHGRLLCGGGALSIIGGVWFLLHGRLKLRWGLGLLEFALLTFASWLLLALRQTLVQLAADPLILAGFGPGLIILEFFVLVTVLTIFLDYNGML